MKYSSCPGFILILVLASCSFSQDISYRKERRERYVKEDGFVLSCNRDGNNLIVGAYTPYSCDTTFYFDFLSGTKATKQFAITAVHLQFSNTADTLILKEVRNKRDYFFTSPNLAKIIAANKNLRLTIYLTDIESGIGETRAIILNRRKHTYLTSTLPHR